MPPGNKVLLPERQRLVPSYAGGDRLDAETKQITYAIRMAACNAETTFSRALDGTTPARPRRGL